MKEIFKNVRNKLAEKYLDNNNLKNSKKFNIKINYIVATITVIILGVIFALLYF